MILFDLPVYNFITAILGHSLSTIMIMKLITTLGSTLVIVSGICSVAILFKNKKYFKIFVVANLIGAILNNLLKLLFRRPRPTTTMVLTAESSYSFPSGHSMMSMIFYGLIIYYVVTLVNKKALRNILVLLLSLIILSVGVSRIYLGVHYATDVVGGFLIGAIYLVCFIKLMNKNSSKPVTNLKTEHKQ